MEGQKKQHVAKLLMVGSLVFLAGFLAIFIYSNYQSEKENIQKEVGYLFVNSIRSIEGGLLNTLMLHSDSIQLPNSNLKHRASDSFKIETVIRNEVHNINVSEGKVEVNFENEETTKSINQMEGSVALFIALKQRNDLNNDSCSNNNRSPEDFLQDLENGFKQNIQLANLPIDYTIVKEPSNTVQVHSIKPSGSYKDVSSGDKYVVQITSFGFLIYKKIFAEIIFSLLLFVCIAMAFYYVHKSLIIERNLLNLKNDFIQNITHELKTPVATVSVALEALQDFNQKEDPLKRKEYIEISKNELKRLNLLIDRVLNISENGTFIKSQNSSPINLNKIVLEIIETLRLQFEKLSIDVRLDFGKKECYIWGDKQLIESVIYNLLDNAMKYNFNPNPKIIIEISQTPDHAIVNIKDNGDGIPFKYHKNIFEKFFRVPHGDVHNVKGHGLGLSFVKDVIQEMKGTIILSSEPSEMTCFSIQLPKYN